MTHITSVRAKRTAQVYGTCLRQFAAFLNTRNWRITSLPATVLQDYADHLSSAGKRPATVALHIAACKTFIEWAKKRGCRGADSIDKDCKLPRIQRRLPPILNDAEIGKYIAAAQRLDEPVATALVLLPLTGLRAGELCGLELADVTWAPEARSWLLHIHDGKSKRDRLVPVLQSGGPLLAHYFAEVRPRLRTESAAFPGVDYRKLLTTIRKIAKQAHLPRITPHCLRHTYASALAHAGLDIGRIAEILGHSNVNTASIYVHRTAEDLCTSLNAVTAPWARTPSQRRSHRDAE